MGLQSSVFPVRGACSPLQLQTIPPTRPTDPQAHRELIRMPGLNSAQKGTMRRPFNQNTNIVAGKSVCLFVCCSGFCNAWRMLHSECTHRKLASGNKSPLCVTCGLALADEGNEVLSGAFSH